ncbi:MAG TPA: M1 family metallopeptidase [Gemmatimonadaceae bacterium]|nr:M1 family metallopeptidase [Gemmatimonadaceae bacterium]
MRKTISLLLALAVTALEASAQTVFTRADTLRGTNSPARSWWDVTFYDLRVSVNPGDSTIRGSNGITYRVVRPGTEMQIDLQPPLVVDSMVQDGQRLTFRRDSIRPPSGRGGGRGNAGVAVDTALRAGNAFFVTLPAAPRRGEIKTVTVFYRGRPRVAVNPPWDGGFGWGTDSLGRPFFSTSNQGLGASVWWPNKDYSGEEPDSQRIAITVPDPLMNVSNGRLRSTTKNADGTTTWEWFVKNPINNYGIAVNAGMYGHFSDTLHGERGVLSLDFYPLSYHVDTARAQFRQVKPVLRCFEKWFGPYPWYEDGFKLVETGHLGMEHQSAVAYGNRYLNGYRGRDLSGTGLGLTWDFIIVHEVAHEWWANNVTATDDADMWIHESFGNYAEGIYQECLTNKEDGARYIIGSRQNIRNEAPIVGTFGVSASGSGDMYYKGGSMLHMIRQIINDDAKWRSILRGLNRELGRRTVSGREVQQFINTRSGYDFDKVFTQYLMTTRIPNLEYDVQGSVLWYRWSNVVPGFDMPVRARVAAGRETLLRPTETWKSIRISVPASEFRVDEDFYVRPVRVNK